MFSVDRFKDLIANFFNEVTLEISSILAKYTNITQDLNSINDNISFAIVGAVIGTFLGKIGWFLKSINSLTNYIFTPIKNNIDDQTIINMVISSTERLISKANLSEEDKSKLYTKLDYLNKYLRKGDKVKSQKIFNKIKVTIDEVNHQKFPDKSDVYFSLLMNQKMEALNILSSMDVELAYKIILELDNKFGGKSKYNVTDSKQGKIKYNDKLRIEAGSQVDLRRVPYDMKLHILEYYNEIFNKYNVDGNIYISFYIKGEGGLGKHPLYCKNASLRPTYIFLSSKQQNINMATQLYEIKEYSLEEGSITGINTDNYSYLYTYDDIYNSTIC